METLVFGRRSEGRTERAERENAVTRKCKDCPTRWEVTPNNKQRVRCFPCAFKRQARQCAATSKRISRNRVRKIAKPKVKLLNGYAPPYWLRADKINNEQKRG